MSDPTKILVEGVWKDLSRPNRQWVGALRVGGPAVVLLTAALPERLLWAKSLVDPSGEVAMAFTVHDLRGASSQLILFAGNGWIQDVVVDLHEPDSLPASSIPAEFVYGVHRELFRVVGAPPVSLGIYVLPRSDARIGRTGVWRPQRGSELNVPPELRVAAVGPRTGECPRAHGAP